MILNQIRSEDGTGTLSYLITDEQQKVAALIDPNQEDVDTIVNLAKQQSARITHIIDTHTHADHISGAKEIKDVFGSEIIMHENTKNKWKVVDQGDKFGIGDILRSNAKVEVDRYVVEGDAIQVGAMQFDVLFTPGHSDNHITLALEDNLFTGDLLLVGQAGRSDLPSGNPEEQYDSLFQKIVRFPDRTKLHPGHDYEDNAFSYLGDEKKSNPFLQPRSKPEYVNFVKEFFPPIADNIKGGKVTLQCGTQRVTAMNEPFQNITPQKLKEMMDANPSLFLLDVREPFELTAYGAIPGVKNISTRQLMQRLNELPSDKSAQIISVCQSGGRSYEVAHYLSKQGYTNVYNLEGGTSGWINKGLPVDKP